jgi:hypothetical protein
MKAGNKLSGLWVGVIGALFSVSANATGIPVVDALHIVQTTYGHYSKYVQDAIQYGKEIEEWKRTYDHYRQQLIQGNAYKGQAGQMPSFAKREPDQGMAESCPTPSITDTLATEQFELCQQIVRAQNAQYNEIVKILETANRRDQELQQIYADRQSVGTDQGRLAANDNQLSSFQARVQMDVQYAELVVDTYDSYLARLKEDQVRLAKEVLTGKAGAVGDIVRGAALSGALKAARKRDR